MKRRYEVFLLYCDYYLPQEGIRTGGIISIEADLKHIVVKHKNGEERRIDTEKNLMKIYPRKKLEVPENEID